MAQFEELCGELVQGDEVLECGLVPGTSLALGSGRLLMGCSSVYIHRGPTCGFGRLNRAVLSGLGELIGSGWKGASMTSWGFRAANGLWDLAESLGVTHV